MAIAMLLAYGVCWLLFGPWQLWPFALCIVIGAGVFYGAILAAFSERTW